jgi:hypothetical protein
LPHEPSGPVHAGSCTHHLRRPSGELSTPNFPENYPNKKECAWFITTTPGQRVRVQFIEFELEVHQECAYDSLQLFDGQSSQNKTLGKFCGSKVPHPVMSSSNSMYLLFRSDSSVQKKGLQAKYISGTLFALQTNAQGRLLRLTSVLSSHMQFAAVDCWR